MDHPVYDVTVMDCKNPSTASQGDSSSTTAEPAPEGLEDDVFTKEALDRDNAEFNADW